jgi:hypothetical protein
MAFLIGCGRSIEAQLEGTWHVDAASVLTPRVTPGAEKKQDWLDATRGLSKIRVTFAKGGQITAQGFGAESQAQWKLNGTSISIEGNKETWPLMTFDSNGPRIHLIIESGSDTLKMDLVK